MILLKSQFHRAFFIATLVLCISILFTTFLEKRTDRPQNRWFITLIGIVFLNAISEIFTTIFTPIALDSHFNFICLLIADNTYFIFHTALCPMLYIYVSSVTGKNRRRKKSKTVLSLIPFFVTEFFTFINPINNCVFYYDDGLTFVRNWAEYLIYAAAIFYFALSIGQLFFSWQSMTFRRGIALAYLFIAAIIGVYIQLVNMDIKAELFAEAIALMGAMIAIESEDDRLDADTRIYNRRALQMDIHSIITMKEQASLIFIKISNANIIERVTRSTNYDVFSIAVADYLKTLVPRYKIYHPNKECFVIIFNQFDKVSISQIIANIILRFEDEWQLYRTAFKLDANILNAKIPTDLNTYDDIIYIADSIIPSGTISPGEEFHWIRRRIDVEQAIRNSLIQGNFEVHYQPTVYADDFHVHGAEALVRMNDSVVGAISPQEFIPIAEQIGVVDQIDDYVLSEVCKFIKECNPIKYQYDCINVNLSVIQCLQNGFVEHILKLVDEYGIDHSYINFEITESVGAEDYFTLAKVAHDLKISGFHLSMDDYGTGYSNMEGMFELEFDIVKIDKSILWNADKSERGRSLLVNSIRMIKDLGCEVLVEGIETKEHVELLQQYDVDYMQGFYFSKPIPKTLFLDYLSK